MLDGGDIGTFHAVRLLCESISENTKPILFWIGAGASSWSGYLRWDELADYVHSRFLRSEAHYNKQAANELLNSRKYPEFFQLCIEVNRQRYLSLLVNSLKPR